MTDPNNPSAPQPPAYQPPAYPASSDVPEPGYAGANAPVPGKTLGIVALILAIIPFTQLFGLILGIIALVQSRKAGRKNGVAVAAIIVAAVLLVLSIVLTIVLVVVAVSVGGDLASQVQACIDNNGQGTVVFQGVTMTCAEVLERANN